MFPQTDTRNTIFISILLPLAIAGGVFWYVRYYKKTSNIVSTDQTATPNTSQSASATTTPTVPSTPAPAPALEYPISQFTERATVNLFGSSSASRVAKNKVDPDVAVCGAKATIYSGYHTAVDLEAFPSELDSAVPVVAITDGVVKQISPVTGYGGLAVIAYTINGEPYTAYYGHIDLSSSSLKAGSEVKKGDKIASLGAQCTAGNGYVRKHLHFGLHKGTSIDVRGYAPDKTTLSNWIDPTSIF